MSAHVSYDGDSMPTNGLKESTSFSRATVKVSFSSAGVGGCRLRQGEAGDQAAEQQSGGGGHPPGSTLAPVTEPTPPVAPREPFEHTEHGVARPDPYHWMHGSSARS